MDIWYYVLTPFTWLLTLYYNIFGSYGSALIIFALTVKLILFPFSLKGKRGMIQMNMVQGKIQAVQKKYANDKERQNIEVQKLYEREKINPMGGCLWSMLPLFVLFPLYAIIRQPMKYVMGLTGEQITTLLEVLGTYSELNATGSFFQLQGADVLAHHFSEVVANPAVAGFAGNLKNLNFQFLGLNLADIPTVKFWADGISWGSIGLFLIPIVSACTGLVFSWISMKTNSVNGQASQQQNSTNKSMLIMSPLMSLWIGFTMPGCLGVYWVANNLLSMLQEFVAGKMLKKDYEAAALAREENEQREKEEEKVRRREAAERKAQALADAKTAKGRKKLAQEKKKNDSAVIGVSSVGIRAYARGRGYDPYRFSEQGPTTYRDPGEPVDEEAVEEALEKKRFFSRKKDKQSVETEAQAIEAADVVEEAPAAETPAEVPAAPDQGDGTAVDAEDPWKALDQEIEDITADADEHE